MNELENLPPWAGRTAETVERLGLEPAVVPVDPGWVDLGTESEGNSTPDSGLLPDIDPATLDEIDDADQDSGADSSQDSEQGAGQDSEQEAGQDSEQEAGEVTLADLVAEGSFRDTMQLEKRAGITSDNGASAAPDGAAPADGAPADAPPADAGPADRASGDRATVDRAAVAARVRSGSTAAASTRRRRPLLLLMIAVLAIAAGLLAGYLFSSESDDPGADGTNSLESTGYTTI